MPDIVSRIRVEAQGADQAAREIRKLRDAYNEVAQAGRNLSPAGVGADPFAQATSAPGGGVYGGQRAPADIADRQNSARAYRDDVQQRQVANSSYNQTLRGAPGAITGGMGALEQAAGGQGAGAAAGGMGLLSMIGGPAGIALAGGAAIAYGVQKFADKAFGRLESVWGSGMAQRLGGGFRTTQNLITGFARTGVPMEMVQGYFNAASQAGMTMDPAMLPATQMAMEAMAMTGVAPGQMGAMMGAFSRAGIGGMGANYNLYSMMKGTFGQANMGTFVQEITRATESSMQRGIDVNPQEAIRQANLIGAYSQYGGLSPTGAAALSQMTLERGRNAAALSKPEDIIAFQMMRKADPTMSASETMMAMEEKPTEVNRKVYEYLKGATGGDQDILRFRMKQYLGPGATMHQANALIQTFEGRSKMTDVERNQLASGLDTEAWRGRTFDEERGEWISQSKERQVYAIHQLDALKGIQEGALDLTTAIGEIGRIFTGEVQLNALRVTFEGYQPDMAKKISQSQQIAEEGTRADLTALYEEIAEGEQTARETKRTLRMVETPFVSRAAATGAELRKDPALMSYMQQQYERAGISEQFAPIAEGGTAGPWSFMVKNIIEGMMGKATAETYEETLTETGSKREARQARNDLQKNLAGLYESLMHLGEQDMTKEEALMKLTELILELQTRGVVFTDGEAEGD